MAWPGTVSSGEVIASAHLNNIVESLSKAETGSRPTASVAWRGKLWITQGGAGVVDTVEICVKNAADSYEWVALF